MDNYHATPGANTDDDVTVERTYNADGRVKTLTAKNRKSDGGALESQTTTYVCGSGLGVDYDGSPFQPKVYRNDLLRAVIYPDSDNTPAQVDDGTGIYDRAEFWYNAQGEPIQTKDQNGTVHQFQYDKLGRRTADKVILAQGTTVDGGVVRIDVAHEVRGMVGSVTSYSDIGGGAQNVVNDVALAYNRFGLLDTEEQSHSGPADGSKPTVRYTYADGSANTVRPTKVTYPSSTGGREVEYDYASDADADHLSRVYQLKFQGEAVARYTYLGSGSVVQTDYPQPGVNSTLINPTGGDRYANLDKFGRVVNAPWTKTSPGDLVQLKYGYDAAGNRLWRENVLAAYSPYNKDLDELYTYDGVNRLTNVAVHFMRSMQRPESSQSFQRGERAD